MKLPVLLLAALATASLAQAQIPSATPLGRWVTESGNLEVQIAPCGDALCGKVVKVLSNRAMSGPGKAMDAVDPRPALGMEILSGLRSEGGGEFGGRIYNRENAKSYSASIRPVAPDQLEVRAYVWLPLFGKTQLWRRAEAAPAMPVMPATATPAQP